MQTLPQSWIEGFDVHKVELFLLGFELLKDLYRHVPNSGIMRLIGFPNGARVRPEMVVALYGDVFFF